MNTSYVDQLFGNYRLLQLLGRGNSSEIYLGKHEFFHTQAAVKVLKGKQTEHDIATFFAQASILIHLRHTHIVQVYDFGRQDDVAFLVMDHAPNGSLRRLHPRGTPLPLELIGTYIRQVAAALSYIHQHKLIHRDVKPQNMLLGINNEVMLSDFGTAVVSQSHDPIYGEMYDFEGTVIYAAPEQLQGKPRRNSDQYALAIVAFEWLSGVWPFQGTFDDIIQQHLFEPPPSLLEKNCTLSVDIDQIITKALSKEPDERFATVQEFADELLRAIEQVYELKPKPKRQFLSPLPFAP